MKKILAIFFAAGMLCCCSCAQKGPETPGGGEQSGQGEQVDPVDPVPARAHIWSTTENKSYAFQETVKDFGKPASMSTKIVKFTDDKYQTIDGFGFAVTQASGYNLLKMSAADRTAFLEEIFSVEKGLGSSLIRVCIGGSDFSMDEFTCCDAEGISNFAMHDLDSRYLFPILDEIYRINPDVKIIGSPWSCPKWMKMKVDGTGSYPNWTSGRLKPSCYSDYATYFVKWIQAMEQKGYDIYAVTLQNEPLNHGNSMSLYMPWEDQRDFLKVVGPAFKEAGLDTKILAYDHNYDVIDYALNLFADSNVSGYLAGSAWHNYGGSVSALDQIVSQYPAKEIFFTEASIGTWNHENFKDNFFNDFKSTSFDPVSKGCKGVTLWNLMLDQDRKPYRPGGCSTCYGGVTINNSGYARSSIVRNTQYYFIAHFSKVVRQGAVRIGTSGYRPAGVSYLAFRNPDDSIGVVVMNEGSVAQEMVFSTTEHSVTCTVQPRSVTSLML